MRWALALIVIAGCQDSRSEHNGQPQDAAPELPFDGYRCPCSVPPEGLMPCGAGLCGAIVSDGTAFWVASNGHPTRVAMDGSVTSPSTATIDTMLLWDGSVGYGASRSTDIYSHVTTTTVSRFGADGTALAAPVAMNLDIRALLPGTGTALSVLVFAGAAVEVVPLSLGTLSPGTASVVGATDRNVSDVFFTSPTVRTTAAMARVTNGFVVGWTRRGHFQIALATL